MSLNKVIYNKLILQAQEAKFIGLNKLANYVLNSIGSVIAENKSQYDFEKLEENIKKYLWKSALEIVKFYDLESLDIQVVDEILNETKDILIEKLKNKLNLSDFGPLESKLPGEFNKTDI